MSKNQNDSAPKAAESETDKKVKEPTTEMDRKAITEQAQQKSGDEELIARNKALEEEIAQLKSKVSATPDAAKPAATDDEYKDGKVIKVISATSYSYKLDGDDKDVTVTPDKGVRANRKTGNLLDCNMKAGLIIEDQD